MTPPRLCHRERWMNTSTHGPHKRTEKKKKQTLVLSGPGMRREGLKGEKKKKKKRKKEEKTDPCSVRTGP